jgi:hypothetical protein
MQEQHLRNVLLIQSIEESDPRGELLPFADREEATRRAARAHPVRELAGGEQPLSAEAAAFLTERAALLRERVELRAPVVRQALGLAAGLSWLGPVVLGLALLSGVSLAALDGGRRIDILAFPLLGLIAWNLLVYLVVVARRLRGRRANQSAALARVHERWLGWRMGALLRGVARHNAPLAEGMRRFTSQWSAVAHPLLAARTQRLLHVASALVVAGFALAMYVRGLGLRYEAGWDSTFLGAGQVQALLGVIYGPAAWLAGIALPDAAGLQALSWQAGGGDAAPWIHLIAITAALYIVLPRMLLAAVAVLAERRAAGRLAPPPPVLAYARDLLVGTAGLRGERVSVTPYAYAPSPTSLAGLQAVFAGALGSGARIDLRTAVRYGEEDDFAERLARGLGSLADWNVLLMSLAATPEAENHGIALAALRDRLAREHAGALLVLLDEGPYAARLHGDETLAGRLEERRRGWREFVAGYGLQACVLDLRQGAELAADPSALRARLREARWTAAA